MKQYYALFLLLVLASCTDTSQPEVEELYALMEGRFTSEKQARLHPDYYNTTIQLAHIWEQRDGYWVYGEYSLTSNPDSPYAQRIYQLIPAPENSVRMESYDLEVKHDFVGKWEEPELFNTLSTADLLHRQGCELYFLEKEEAFHGETKGNCSIGLGKAAYSTHQFIISPDSIVNWARGFDSYDNLVWGKTDGGYVLEKIKR